ncbi:hypothetical protein A2707_03345 [Candidatus Saccharibacteria bacterium RIFCSPHIGHO2_01_FULL_45_15]|nr:MAG: hypothetical protein A2707_03345 [Candidatus Saccharibacteria bacterium RIFCSPHIGHO2_01_FULL_45_15]OGL27253.1 MAG: hypothetical protein A3C39_04535 [Candidatus Saccharibacteria bacterium RIFCSPHIGHO2_02_FULL_46_12]OGL32466.1 MAG: hypothetical protein A3E76_00225 [Candidatus Saccharibacteria bacterium RIFCSPHIGHO2_12_FULL_44_22]
MNKLIKSAIAGVFLGSILATTACGDWRSNDEINAENARMSLEVCQDGEVLHLLEPQTDTRDGVKTVTLPPNGVSDVGDFWLTDGQSWSPDRTPKATEEDPNPKTEFGHFYQTDVEFRYVLKRDKTIARLYIKPENGAGQELSPAIQPGSEGSLTFDPKVYAESYMLGGNYYMAPEIESISVCTK